MGILDKLKAAIKKIKGKLIAFGILLVVIIVWFIIPFSVAINTANQTAGMTLAEDTMNGDWWNPFLIQLGKGITSPLKQIGPAFSADCIGILGACLKWVFIISAFAVSIGILKALPKHEYENIENGSSDWCENGEQYKVLSKNKGIILAEKNYLPVDKRGNVNVLVVRRFWCW